MISLWRLLERLKQRRNRALASRRCELGDGTVVFNPSLIEIADPRTDRVSIGRESYIRGALITLPGGHIRVGDHCYLGEASRLWSNVEISIGDRVLIAHNVNVFDNATHPMDPVARHAQFRSIVTSGQPRLDLGGKPVRIDDDVWIACGVIVLPGVHIGKAAVIGAGSVVTRDVPAFCLAAGNPAKVIRELTAAERGSFRPEVPA